jgi:uncharacterized protein YdhG (YjbR/CyaY superfamily)
MKAKRPARSTTPGEDGVKQVNAILAKIPVKQRSVLQKIRKTIQASVSEAVEGISYGLPAFRYKGKPLAGYAAYKEHYSFFPMSGKLTDKFKQELKEFDTSKGAIHFQADHPLPTTLIKKLLRARIQEIEKG